MKGSTQPTDAADELEAADNDVVRAVSTWQTSDVAALVEEGGDIGPVTRLGDVVNIEEFHADGRILVEVNLR